MIRFRRPADMTHRSRTIAALFTLLAATAAPLSAQTSGALAGTVRDAVSGRGIAEAVVPRTRVCPRVRFVRVQAHRGSPGAQQ